MELRVFTEPQQGTTYEQLCRVARAAEDAGFGGFFRPDHYPTGLRPSPTSHARTPLEQNLTQEVKREKPSLLAMGGDGLPGSTDAWLTLAGLARETTRIRLGTLMSAATSRYPGSLAIAVAQADAISGGRVELGLGTGWFQPEHPAYGLPFPETAELFGRLRDQLAIITGLWDTPLGSTFTYHGEFYQLIDSPALPKPVQQPRPPVLLGGVGIHRTPVLAAQFADEYNAPFLTAAMTRERFGRVRAACERAERDPKTLLLSAALVLCCGRDEAEVRRRADAIGRDPDELRANGLAGTPAEVVDKIGRYAELGATRIYLQTLDLNDLDHLELVAAEVMPQV